MLSLHITTIINIIATIIITTTATIYFSCLSPVPPNSVCNIKIRRQQISSQARYETICFDVMQTKMWMDKNVFEIKKNFK